ncbi:MAG: IclR family transcriptional regulator [Planctomycetia bacterium]
MAKQPADRAAAAVRRTAARGRPARSAEPDLSRYHVPNLKRALSLMEFLATQPGGMGVSDLARALEIPKNSVFRITATLHAFGYLQRRADNSFTLGPKLLTLAHLSMDEQNLVGKSLDVLTSLRDETGETVLIGTLSDGEGVVLEELASPQPIKVTVTLGRRFPIHTAAPAKAMLAAMPPEERQAIVSTLRFSRFTPHTITSRRAFEQEIAAAKARGFATDHSEEVEGISCVAAAILDFRDRPIGAVWITGPSFRIPKQDIPAIAASVQRAAAAISSRFGLGGGAGRGMARA